MTKQQQQEEYYESITQDVLPLEVVVKEGDEGGKMSKKKICIVPISPGQPSSQTIN